MTWTDGYISDVSYPAFFYKEMQPLWLSTVAGFLGFSAPDVAKPFALCELGCGVGINLLIAAACHPQARFVGVDFNAEHLRVARDAARSSGIRNIDFIQMDFSEFARGNREEFDFVTSHGAWSWIAPQYRDALLDGASGGLKSGGLLYLHYMCHPGSTELLPFQHLLNLAAHHMPGSSPRKAQTGLKLLQHMADSGLYADRPFMLRHLANMARRDPADLAHEFLTDHWQPQHSVDVHQQAGQAGLAFLGSADVFNNLDASLSIPGQLQALIWRTGAPALAETMKDMARNAHQRMDLFQKDPAGPNAESVIAGVGETLFQLLPGAPQRGAVSFSTPIGPIAGSEAIFSPLLRKLAAGPASGGELSQLPIFADQPDELLPALQLLMMQEMVHPAKRMPRTDDDRADSLSRWFERNGIARTVIGECATATRQAGKR